QRERIAAQLDDGNDRIADDVALAGREVMDDGTTSRAERHHFGSRAGRIHEVKARAFRFHGGFQYRTDLAAADFLDVAHRLFFDGGQATTNISFGRLRAEQIDALALDKVGVVIEHVAEPGAHFGSHATGFDDVFAAGEFARFAEDQCGSALDEALESATDSR